MQVITTTQLRTKSKQLLKALQEGRSIDLIHRSKIVGEIKPKIHDPKPFNAEAFLKVVEKMNLPKTTPAERERRYRAHLMKKYGKNIR